MSDAVLIAVCTLFGGLLGTIIQGVIGLIRGKHKDDAEAEKADAEAAELIRAAALALVEPLKKRVVELEAEVCELSKRMDTANRELRELHIENGDLREWAERLVHQVKSQGVDPVKIRKRNGRAATEAGV